MVSLCNYSTVINTIYPVCLSLWLYHHGYKFLSKPRVTLQNVNNFTSHFRKICDILHLRLTEMKARGRISSQRLKVKRRFFKQFHMVGAFPPLPLEDVVANWGLWVVCRFGDTPGRVPPAAVTLVLAESQTATSHRRKTRRLGLGWAQQALSRAFQDLPCPVPHPLTSQWAGCTSPNCGFTSPAAASVWEARDPRRRREPHFFIHLSLSLTAQHCTFHQSVR